MSNTYTVHCTCNNCDFSGPVEIPKGTVAAVEAIVCPNCGCRHLRKTPKPDPIEWTRGGRHPYMRDFTLTTTPAIPMNSPEVPFPGKPSTVYCSATGIE